MAAPSGRACRREGAGGPPLLVAALALLLLAGAARACTTIMAGAKASADGSLYLARTVDYTVGDLTNNLKWTPAREAPAVFASNSNYLEATLPAPGLAYLAAPCINAGGYHNRGRAAPASGSASLEEVGVNSAGVVVSATETITARAAALAADPLVADTGLTEDALASLLLPHPEATTARATVQARGRLLGW